MVHTFAAQPPAAAHLFGCGVSQCT